MKVILFVGPSVQQALIHACWQGIDYEICPPVRQGDVYLACKKRPRAIGIIDGYFETIPAVWHKEILWAIKQGIQVFGAASMGALRAAELSAYGMQGVGKVFEAYASGELEDDDEVAVLHGDKSHGYPALSEAMVNIRQTLTAAAAVGVISPEQAEIAGNKVKGLHYSRRHLDSVLASQSADGPVFTQDDKRRLSDFWVSDYQDLKARDGEALLGAIKASLGHPHAPPEFVFQYTDNWQQMIDKLEAKSEVPEPEQAEVQLYHSAAYRQHAIRESYRQGVVVNPEMLAAAKRKFCEEKGFIHEGQIQLQDIWQWMQARRLNMPDFERLIEQQARFYWYCQLTPQADHTAIEEYRLAYQR